MLKIPEDLQKEITRAEHVLFSNLQDKLPSNFRALDGSDRLESASTWGDERTLRANFLHWLLTDINTTPLVQLRGFQLIGAKIIGKLDLANVNIPFSILIAHCLIEDDLIVSNANIRSINLIGSHIKSLIAESLTIRGDMLLVNVNSKKVILLNHAKIGGKLNCTKANITNKEMAIHAVCIDIGGDAIFNELIVQGEIRLLNANIGGRLSFQDAIIENENEKAISADGITINGNFNLVNLRSIGEVRLLNANIGGQLICDGARFENKEGKAFNADGLTISSIVKLT